MSQKFAIRRFRYCNYIAQHRLIRVHYRRYLAEGLVMLNGSGEGFT